MNFVLDIVTSFVGSDLPGTELSNNESIQKYLEDKSCNYLSIVINNQDNKKKIPPFRISNSLINAGSSFNQKTLLLYKTEPCAGSKVADCSGVIFKPKGKTAAVLPVQELGKFEDDLFPLLNAHLKHLADENAYWLQQPSDERSKYFSKQLTNLNGLMAKSFGGDFALTLFDYLDFEDSLEECWDAIWSQTDFSPYPEDRFISKVIQPCLLIIATRIQSSLAYSLWSSGDNAEFASAFEFIKSQKESLKTLEKRWKNDRLSPLKGSLLDCAFRFHILLENLGSVQWYKNFFTLSHSILNNHELLEAKFESVQEMVLNEYAIMKLHERINLDKNFVLKPILECLKIRFTVMMDKVAEKPFLLTQFINQHQEFLEFEFMGTLLGTVIGSYLKQRMLEISEIEERIKYKNFDFEKDDIVEWLTRNRSLQHSIKELLQQIKGCKNASGNDFGLELEELRSAESLVKGIENEMFQSWADHVDHVYVEGGSGMGAKVFEFDSKTGKLTVGFSEKLVKTLRDIRSLCAMGYNISPTIVSFAQRMQRIFRYGTMLKQIANFYNTVDQEMLPFQRTMLVNRALKFESLIKSSASSSNQWDNLDELDSYLKILNEACFQLLEENQLLKGFHESIINTLAMLVNVNLVSDSKEWKSLLNSAKTIISKVESRGYTQESMQPWLFYLDVQLFKVLDHQFKTCLARLSSSIPQIELELNLFQRDVITFKPPLEDIRLRVGKEVKRFLSIPSFIKGFSERVDFTKISQKYPHMIEKIFILSEEAIASAKEFAETWKKFSMMQEKSKYNNNDVDNNMKAEEWETLFRGVKTKGKELEIMPLKSDFGIISVSSATLKMSLEGNIQAYFESLVSSLRSKISNNVAKIEDFIRNSLELISKKPQSMDEIGHANHAHNSISRDKKEFQAILDNLGMDAKLLLNVAGIIIEIEGLTKKWAKLDIMLESHDLMIKDQIAVLIEKSKVSLDDFNSHAAKFQAIWDDKMPKNVENFIYSSATAVLKTLNDLNTEYQSLLENYHVIEKQLEFFGFPVETPVALEKLKSSVESGNAVWQIYADFVKDLGENFAEKDWITVKMQLVKWEEFLEAWKTKVMERIQGHSSPVLASILRFVDSLYSLLPLWKLLKQDHWGSEYWMELANRCSLLDSQKFVSLEKIMFSSLLDNYVIFQENTKIIKDLNSKAQADHNIRRALDEIDVWSVSAALKLTDYIDSQGNTVAIVRDWKGNFSDLGDNQSMVQSLKETSAFSIKYKDKIQIWETRLIDLSEALTLMNNVQRRWLYLEPVFGKTDLFKDEKRFKKVDSNFRAILEHIKRDSRLMNLLTFPSLHDALKSLNETLEKIQRQLCLFLEEKRSKFARFYFIGDDDLLEIIGQSKNPQSIQNHLKKLFAGISSVVFAEDKGSIVAISSSENEIVKLKFPVILTDKIEEWLSNLVLEMKKTLKSLLVECLQTGAGDMMAFPQQIVSLAKWIQFTAQAEDALGKGTLKELLNDLRASLKSLTSYDLNKITDEKSRKVMEFKVKALIMDYIHFIDVAEGLLGVKGEAVGVKDWDWQKQLRFYLRKDNVIVVRMCHAEFEYSYEYQGNYSKLVHTALTDKCYMTLMIGMSHGYGGNPIGPAATGKTESVKSLGALLGRQVIVFNCDEGLDVQSMGRIFIGIVKSASWACFDEFNRLEETVLSAVSQQIQSIQLGIKSGTLKAILMGKSIDVNPDSAIFVTMNPAGKGYGGRQQLPDNLKQLFRPISMTVPDLLSIAKVSLLSDGFSHAQVLGSRLVSLFDICKRMLSTEQHYDWSLRSLKPVLQLSGSLLRYQMKSESLVSPLETESKCVYESVEANIVSKLNHDDVIQFQRYLVAAFGPLAAQSDINQNLKEKILKTLGNNNMLSSSSDSSKEFIEKVVQFHESCKQRIGVLLLGPPRSGKSSIWRICKETLEKEMGFTVNLFLLEPKSMDKRALLGFLDHETREWRDGVITMASRSAVQKASSATIAELDKTLTWIVADGDVDPEWIESLNSVLDDNRLLTMSNGERIRFGKNINFIFETDALSFASPATISRLSVIYVPRQLVGVQSLITKFGLEEEAEKIKSICTLAFGSENMAKRMGDLETALRISAPCSGSKRVCMIAQHFASIMPSILSSEFLQKVKSLVSDLGNHYYSPKIVDAIEADPSSTGSTPKSSSSSFFFVNDSVKRQMLQVIPYLESSMPLILCGASGMGKTHLVKCIVNMMYSQPNTVIEIHCSNSSDFGIVSKMLIQSTVSIMSSRGKVLKAKYGSRIYLLLKHIDLPAADKYGTIPMMAFLHGLIHHGGFYDDNQEWVWVEGLTIIGTSDSDSKSLQNISSRMQSMFAIVTLPTLDPQDAKHIFMSSLSAQCQFLKENQIFRDKCSAFLKSLFSAGVSMRSISGIIKCLSYFDWESVSAIDHRDLVLFLKQQTELVLPKKSADSISEHFGQVDAFPSILDSIPQEWLSSVIFRLRDKEKLFYKDEFQSFSKDCQKSLFEYNRDIKKMELFIDRDVIADYIRIEGSLCFGSCLLIGKRGCGRRSLTNLVAHSLGFNVHVISFSVNHSNKSTISELKTLINKSVIEQQGNLIMFEDFEMGSEISDLVSLCLHANNLSYLFSKEELDVLANSIGSTLDEGCNSVMDVICLRMERYFRIVCIVDESNKSLLLNNPYFRSNFAAIKFEFPSERFYESLTGTYLKPLQFSSDIIDNVGRTLSAVKSTFKQDLTPVNLYLIIFLIQSVFLQKRGDLLEKSNHYKSGVEKIDLAKETVQELSKAASEQEFLLREKEIEADRALQQITERMVLASEQKIELEKVSSSLVQEEAKLSERKRVIESQLAEVEPLIRRAKESVGQIKNENLTEIRSLRAPPATIRDILEGVLRLMGIYDTSWSSMKSFLGKRTVKDEIINFDARNISPETRDSVEKLMREKAEAFDEVNAKRSSVAAEPLATWVKANVEYSRVLENVVPLEKDLKSLEYGLANSKNKILQLKQELENVEVDVASLKDEFSRKTGDAQSLKTSLGTTRAQLAKSSKLVQQLSNERTRWQTQMDHFEENLKCLPFKSILTAIFLVLRWEGYFTEFYDIAQRQLGFAWGSEKVVSFMVEDSEIVQWKTMGLIDVKEAFENALLIQHFKEKTALIIDPGYTCLEWLKAVQGKDKKIDLVSASDANLSRTLELAVRFGRIVIIKDVTKIDLFLLPLIRKDYGETVKFCGDRVVNVHDDFRLFLVAPAKMVGNVIPPGIQAYLNVIDFSVTLQGLKDQLQTFIIKFEKPELEVKRREQIEIIDRLQLDLFTIEEFLLKDLSNSQGNILDNEPLLKSLEASKEKSAIVQESLKEAFGLEQSLERERSVFGDFAILCSKLYFALERFQLVRPIYKWSLGDLYVILERSLVHCKRKYPQEDDLRIKHYGEIFSKTFYAFVIRSIFAEDQPAISLHILKTLQEINDTSKEWDTFEESFAWSMDLTTTNAKSNDTGLTGNGVPLWVPANRRAGMSELMKRIPEIKAKYNLDDASIWSSWQTETECENHFPVKVTFKSDFDKVLLIQVLRPDRLLAGISMWCRNSLQSDSSIAYSSNPMEIVKETLPTTTPILYIVTTGADPTAEITACASALKIPLEKIPMGQGQEALISKSLLECKKNGKWLLLQNIHLGSEFVANLLGQHLNVVVDGQGILLPKTTNAANSDNIGDGGGNLNQVHENFRLWLTAEERPSFPSSILRKSLKLVLQISNGLKVNIKRSLLSIANSSGNNVGAATKSVFKYQAFFLLSWLHGIVQERRNFVPLGWSKIYEFGISDLRFGAQILDYYCKGGDFSWKFARGIFESCVHGAFLDNEWDRNKLNALLERTFDDEIPCYPELQQYIKYCDSVSVQDEFSIMTLPSNTAKIVQQRNGQRLAQNLKMLKLEERGEDDFRDSVVISTCKRILEIARVPVNSGKKKEDSHEREDILRDFLVKEIEFGTRLLNKIRSSISKLMKELVEEENRGKENRDLIRSLRLNVTPEIWLSNWSNGPKSLFVFVNAVVNNVNKLMGKVSGTVAGQGGQEYRLSEYFSPETLITLFRQITCEKEGCLFDDLELTLSMENSSNAEATFQGLYFQGANFTSKPSIALSEVEPGTEILLDAPIIYCRWTRKSNQRNDSLLLGSKSDGAAGHRFLPLYLKQERSSEIGKIQIPIASSNSNDPALNLSKWQLYGSAFFIHNIN